MKIAIVSLGCSKNLVDTEKLLGLLISNDLKITNNFNEADAIIINTCGFIEPAKKEAIDTILQMSEYENCKHLIVMGCLVQRYKKELEEELYEVDKFIKISEYNNLGDILSEELGIKISNTYGKTDRVLSGKPWMAYLRISDGCDNRCSYCAIPLIRGRYISTPIEELIIEANKLVKMGVKELNIIAQDTTRYGLDLYGKRRLLDLLSELNNIEELHWIRVLYMYPDEIDEELIKGISKLNKVLPYFDIPVQYGNDKLLKLMNRRGSVEEIKNVIERIRITFKNPILRTTIIVGFPYETSDDFNDTLNFIEEIKWDKLGAFTYSKEEDTKAYDMDNEIDEDIKIERLNILMNTQNEITNLNNKKYINETIEVLIEGYDALLNVYRGRGFMHAPDGIDGQVFVYSDEKLNLGEFVMVKINDFKNHDLIGEYKRRVMI
ncbi:MAG: 30S ribosomal protein S12 methylthiotransferase RimO [Erysipelotrichaceae bacterium]|jgi:ribosomal protein S12 methylthiotransferase|nr:30S ribosomal protein S12 methylthiotransferase RimO [Bacillota bacterium]NLP22332.1 30S ribosomal protein S12 methylthiotransferase RimO [Erysipelotrichaceae bacterium]